jgi:hypothetical protein
MAVRSIYKHLRWVAIFCIGPSAHAQVITGAEATYGGEGDNRHGHVFTIGIPVSKGEIEYGILLSIGRRYTAEPVRRRAPDESGDFFSKSGDETLYFIRPAVMYSSGFGFSPRLGIARQVRRWYPDTHTPEIRFGGIGEMRTYFYYGADVHYRPLSWLQFTAGFAPRNGVSFGAYLVWDLTFLKK